MKREQIEKINSRYTVLLKSYPCPKCGSLQLCLFIENEDGTPAARTICLKCGHEGTLGRFRAPHVPDAEKLNTWSNIVRNNDDRRCRICGSTLGLEAHHLIPKSHDPSGMYWYDPHNGIAVCRRCHELIHGKWMQKYDRGGKKKC